jgi:hypothetical protein
MSEPNHDFLGGDASKDPHDWKLIIRDADGFVAETNPGQDAQFWGGNDRATMLIAIDWGTVTSITYQLVHYIAPLNKFVPGPEKTVTPTDPGQRFVIDGMATGIKFKAMAGSGNASIYVAIANRAVAGS